MSTNTDFGTACEAVYDSEPLWNMTRELHYGFNRMPDAIDCRRLAELTELGMATECSETGRFSLTAFGRRVAVEMDIIE